LIKHTHINYLKNNIVYLTNQPAEWFHKVIVSLKHQCLGVMRCQDIKMPPEHSLLNNQHRELKMMCLNFPFYYSSFKLPFTAVVLKVMHLSCVTKFWCHILNDPDTSSTGNLLHLVTLSNLNFRCLQKMSSTIPKSPNDYFAPQI